jgi:hypothetical protein
MSAKSFLAGFAMLLSSAIGAQTPATSGYFVSTLGNDTLSIERFTRSTGKLEGDILRRSPRVTLVHYVADLSDGRFKGMSMTTRRVGGDPATPPAFSVVTLFADSTATLEVLRNGKADTTLSGRRPFAGRVGPQIPGSPPSLGLYEEYLALNSPTPVDSNVVTLIGAGSAPGATITIARRGRDVAFTSSFYPGWTEIAKVDANGRLQSLDASATTVKAISKRVASLDFDGIARQWNAYETAHGPAGQVSPADTVRATIGAANIEIAYSRPAKRGRVIFGGIVPWNQVWRTGANAATQLTTSADLMFGTTVVPAGKYTLWSLPTPTGAKLIINSETGQWGTDYDASKDFARLDLTQTMLTSPVESFTFAIARQPAGGVLKFSWDNREYSIPFRIK